jgi:nitroreductase/NAD-dependent dihydropyrimidine dehydrogenase PreA subunit
MNPVVIDLAKCNQDGICAAVCPRKLIDFSKDDPTPKPVANIDEVCIRCGHCMAACPTAAISLEGVIPEDCPPVRPGLLPGFESLDHLMRSRRSIRAFKNKPVEKDKTERLVDVCRYAPTGSNSQGVHWLAVTGRDALNQAAEKVVAWMRSEVAQNSGIAQRMKLDLVVKDWEAGIDRIWRGANLAFLSHAPVESSLPQENCVIAHTFMDLATVTMGLGTCWIGYFMLAADLDPSLGESFNLPQGHKFYGAMVVGYPKYSYQRIPLRNQAKIEWLE